MVKLDPNDPLDRLLIAELKGDPAKFEQVLDTLNELMDEPLCEDILQERGLDAADVLRDAETYRKEFHARLTAYQLPVNNRYVLCQQLSELAKTTPNLELLGIYCDVLCDPGFLLDEEDMPVDAEDAQDTAEQIILQYLDFLPEREELFQMLRQYGVWSETLSEIAKINRSPKSVDCDSKIVHQVFQCCVKAFRLDKKSEAETLLANLSAFIGLVESEPLLKLIEPLFLFRLLTRHQKRICHIYPLQVNLPALWKQDTGIVDRDNGKNLRVYHRNLELFRELCRIFTQDKQIDFPLCWYGLDQVTVLGDYYREWVSGGVEIEGEDEPSPFPASVEELVDDKIFSCFAHGLDDNLLFTDSDLSAEEYLSFGCNNPKVNAVLEKLSDYMNQHAEYLAERFIGKNLTEVKILCQEILNKSGIPSRCQPGNLRDLALFFAAINGGLMDIQDSFSNWRLVEAGNAFVHQSLN